MVRADALVLMIGFTLPPIEASCQRSELPLGSWLYDRHLDAKETLSFKGSVSKVVAAAVLQSLIDLSSQPGLESSSPRQLNHRLHRRQSVFALVDRLSRSTLACLLISNPRKSLIGALRARFIGLNNRIKQLPLDFLDGFAGCLNALGQALVKRLMMAHLNFTRFRTEKGVLGPFGAECNRMPTALQLTDTLRPDKYGALCHPFRPPCLVKVVSSVVPRRSVEDRIEALVELKKQVVLIRLRVGHQGEPEIWPR